MAKHPTYRCSCGNVRRSPGQAKCKSCHAKSMRAWRTARGSRRNYLSPEALKRQNARSYLHVYEKRGKVARPALCQRCLTNPVEEPHHHDYDKPLDVLWVCKLCHKQIHIELRERKTVSNKLTK